MITIDLLVNREEPSERRICIGYKRKSHEYFVPPQTDFPSIQYCNPCRDLWETHNQEYPSPPFIPGGDA